MCVVGKLVCDCSRQGSRRRSSIAFNLVSTQTLWCIVRADAIEELTVRNSFGENEVDTMEAVFMTIGLYEKKTMALFRNLWKKCITE